LFDADEFPSVVDAFDLAEWRAGWWGFVFALEAKDGKKE